MHSIFPEHFKSYRFATALVISVLFTAGCSGSSDSQPPAETNAVNADAVNTDAGSTTNDIENDTAANISEGTAASDPVIVVEPEPTDITPVVEVPEFTRVEFDINVPAFQSNALQVRLQWGSMDILASFVVDESWSASADFPTNTENDLVVTFNDGNGAITLGSFEQSFGTGTNASESFQITSDQFDTERWDSDGDGLSNLSESLAGTNPLGNDPPSAVQASLEIVADKTFRISWEDSDNAEFYRVLENPDGVSGFTQISDDLALSTLTLDHRVALFSRINARYIVQACNDTGCINSTELIVSGTLESAITYVKPSNTRRIQFFGGDVSLSSDGSTLAVGSRFESSLATGINGDQGDDNAPATGAVYVFVNNDGRWEQQAYIKASNANGGDLFGFSVSLNADGNTLAVGAFLESSIATGINGNQNDNSLNGAGAVYVFTRNGSDWQQEAYIKASNTGTVTQDLFGSDVSLSADGNTLAVGALGEDSGAKGVNPMPTQNTISRAGATYVFVRSNGSWQQQAYIKASNSDFGDEFGRVVSLSADGDRLAVGAHKEQSGSSGINGVQTDNSIAGGAGAVYLYARSNDVWQLLAYIKASNPDEDDFFGWSVSLSGDGRTLAVGASGESSPSFGVDNDQTSNSANDAGAVYVFESVNDVWEQQSYLKASNTDAGDQFGQSVSISNDGNTLAVGAFAEQSSLTGLNGNQFDNSIDNVGAAYVFVRDSGVWQQQAYIKSSNAEGGDQSSAFGNGDNFGGALSLSADANTLAVGADNEDGGATGINGDQSSNSAFRAGAVYLY